MSSNIVDLLCTLPVKTSFADRVSRLQLNSELEDKITACHEKKIVNSYELSARFTLTQSDEEEIATSVLYNRYRFTECLFNNDIFRQAVLTVIQNIYLFRNRRIFFVPEDNTEQERQIALDLFSSPLQPESLNISKTLQHLIVSRVWSRIQATADHSLFQQPEYIHLHSIILNLNTLRNIYMLFSERLTRRMARRINPVYGQTLSYEDALQVGNFGVARAAYRYHHSSGIRFSTYAAQWIKKELQRQALDGRLIRIPSHVVEKYAAEKKRETETVHAEQGSVLSDALQCLDNQDKSPYSEAGLESTSKSPENLVAEKQQRQILLNSIDNNLSGRTADLIRRRYGLTPYESASQSVIEIAAEYGVSRGRVYQLEQDALKILRKAICSVANTKSLQAKLERA